MKFLQSKIGSIWFWWILLTIIYALFNAFGYPVDQSEMKYELVGQSDGVTYEDGDFREITFGTYFAQHPVDGILTISASIVGIFVPYGAASLMVFIISFLSWISAVVFLLLMFVANKKLSQLNIGILRKVLLILAILMVLTMIVDLIRETPFVSWSILFHASAPHYCC